jgi:PAS domain S-box-containing protein
MATKNRKTGDAGELRKRAEAEAESARDYIANIVNAIGDPVFVKDGQHRFVLVNDAECALVGHSRADLIGKTDADFFPQEQVGVFWEMDDLVLNTGHENVNEELLTDARTGETRTIVTRKTRYVAPNGNRFVIGVIRDITEHKRDAQALVQSEAHYRGLVESANDIIWRMDLQGRFTFVNSVVKKLAGYEPEEILGKHFEDFAEPPSTEVAAASFERRLSGKVRREGVPLTLVHRRKDGSVFQGEVLTSPIFDMEDRLLEIQGVTRDITEHKRAEEAVRIALTKYKTLFEVIPIGLTVSDKTGKIVEANQVAETLLGISREEHTRRKIDGSEWRIVRLDGTPMPAGEYASVRALKENRLVENVEMGIVKSPDDTTWISVTASPVPLEGYGVIIAYCDITERKRAEQTQARLVAILDATPGFVGFADAKDTRIRYINPFGRKMVGLDAQEDVTHLKIADVHPEWTNKLFRDEIIPTAIRDGVWIGECAFLNRDGREIPVMMVLLAHKSLSGEVERFSTISMDITERKRVEAEKEKLEAQLRQVQKMEAVGQLAGGVAHDFNNLLQVILGYVHILQADLGKDTAHGEVLDAVRQAGERAADLTRQLLAFSRRQIIQPVNLDLNDLIQDVLKMIRRVIGEDMELCYVPGDRLGTIYVDKGQIEQILMNLCVNARDAMPTGGTLTIETENVVIGGAYCREHPWATEGRYVLLSVTDTGHGMDEATRTQVFDPFFTTKAVGQGTGLGLATVYGIVKHHDGLIHVYSEPGKGTAFKVYLPIVERSAEEVGPKVEEAAVGGTETILVAEDEEMVRDLLSNMLQTAGYTVLMACDGEEALRVFEEHADAIDLAILDVMMPKLGGREVMDRIQARCPRVRFLFSSGYSANAIHTNFVIKEKLHLITKPYRRADLLRAIRERLDNAR